MQLVKRIELLRNAGYPVRESEEELFQRLRRLRERLDDPNWKQGVSRLTELAQRLRSPAPELAKGLEKSISTNELEAMRRVRKTASCLT